MRRGIPSEEKGSDVWFGIQSKRRAVVCEGASHMRRVALVCDWASRLRRRVSV